MTNIQDLHQQWLCDPEYRDEFDRLSHEFAVVQAETAARLRAESTQTEE
ncbi:MAG: hypothetical protein AAGE92_11650 [Cyanobacteria bacterium P01_G01_bin.4]